MKPQQIYDSGFVQRYSSRPTLARYGQTLAAHQWGVAMILKILKPDAPEALLMAALTHDVGELVVGDLPYPFKRANPEFTAEHEIIEHRSRREILGVLETVMHLSGNDEQFLKLCDQLESVMFVKNVEPGILKTRPWRDMIERLLTEADYFNVRSKVIELIGIEYLPY